MFAVIDCGTTNTRIFILSDNSKMLAQGVKKIGVRDTSITGSRKALKEGVEELFQSVIKENSIDGGQVHFAIASGMITSEIGLIEIPHLVAPVGLKELSEQIEIVTDPDVINLGVPVYFIRGIRNDYGDKVTAHNLREIDFMRGEEVQCIGILSELAPKLPLNTVVLSSHTKIIHIDKEGRISRSITTMSGQIFEALNNSTNVGKSIVNCSGEEAGGYTYEEIVSIAANCVENAGFVRSMLMPRLMQVLLKTNSDERQLFVDAAIAADDMKAFQEAEALGCTAERYIIFGNKERCKLYEYLIHKNIGVHIEVQSIFDAQTIADITIKGAIIIARHVLDQIKD